MLKRLLAVTLAVMLVMAVAGIASAHHRCRCKTDIDVDLEIDVNLTDSTCADMVLNNVLSVCTSGDSNLVTTLDQYGGSNLLIIEQKGDMNEVSSVLQDNDTSLAGMNVATICQRGDLNIVTDIYQYQ